MTITGVRQLVLGTAWRNLTFVVVSTDEGIDGVGEVRMINNTEALLGYLAEAATNHVVGADPFAIEMLVQRMWHGDYGRPGQIAMSGIAAVEIACWDIVGKALGHPVYRLLGGPVRGRIKARRCNRNASAGRRSYDHETRDQDLDEGRVFEVPSIVQGASRDGGISVSMRDSEHGSVAVRELKRKIRLVPLGPRIREERGMV